MTREKRGSSSRSKTYETSTPPRIHLRLEIDGHELLDIDLRQLTYQLHRDHTEHDIDGKPGLYVLGDQHITIKGSTVYDATKEYVGD